MYCGSYQMVRWLCAITSLVSEFCLRKAVLYMLYMFVYVVYTPKTPPPSSQGSILQSGYFLLSGRGWPAFWCMSDQTQASLRVTEGWCGSLGIMKQLSSIFEQLLLLHSSPSLLFPPRVAWTSFWSYRKKTPTLVSLVFCTLAPLNSLILLHPLFYLACSHPTGRHAAD